MKYIFFLLLITGSACAQSDKTVLKSLRKSVRFLADDKLEGRRTGTAGEKMAYEYISKQFKKAGLRSFPAYPDFIQPFEVQDGKGVDKPLATINGQPIQYGEDYFPLAYSADCENFTTHGGSGIQWLWAEQLINVQKDNPHFDCKSAISDAAKEAVKNNKKCLLIVAGNLSATQLSFEKNDKTARLGIPVIVLKESVMKNFPDYSTAVFQFNYSITERKRTGHNVIGFHNNGAAQTVIIGAHYDHLGYGEDHNSLYTGGPAMIHNGADDNASGTAGLITLATILKKANTQFNYLFVAFSGEELGLYGSKYFTEHSPVDLKQVNYMINMDMIGRLNDSTHGITIGGYGTSPAWGKLIQQNDDYFKIKIDSAGSGPSDHTSFYRKDIPVLFFFTGTHGDYHKPSDDADKINYAGQLKIVRYIQNIVAKTASMEKLSFSKTREAAASGKSSFKVSMGIMPDYTYSGEGVLVDGVTDGRPAQKAGLKAGDVVYQLGDHPVTDVQTYMQALNKFNKGESARVKIRRGKENLEFTIVF